MRSGEASEAQPHQTCGKIVIFIQQHFFYDYDTDYLIDFEFLCSKTNKCSICCQNSAKKPGMRQSVSLPHRPIFTLSEIFLSAFKLNSALSFHQEINYKGIFIYKFVFYRLDTEYREVMVKF